MHAEPCGPPNQFTIQSHDNHSVTLSWTEVDCDKQNGPILGYVITQVYQDNNLYASEYNINGRDSLLAVVPFETGNLDTKPGVVTHKFSIAARNKAGTGVFTPQLTVTL